jgi:hypothetical protein
MPNHLDKALDDLARERRRLEDALARVPLTGSRALTEAFGIHAEIRSNEITTKRLEERARRVSVQDAAAEALAGLFADEPKDLGDALAQADADEKPSISGDDDGDHPLAGLFA